MRRGEFLFRKALRKNSNVVAESLVVEGTLNGVNFTPTDESITFDSVEDFYKKGAHVILKFMDGEHEAVGSVIFLNQYGMYTMYDLDENDYVLWLRPS